MRNVVTLILNFGMGLGVFGFGFGLTNAGLTMVSTEGCRQGQMSSVTGAPVCSNVSCDSSDPGPCKARSLTHGTKVTQWCDCDDRTQVDPYWNCAPYSETVNGVLWPISCTSCPAPNVGRPCSVISSGTNLVKCECDT